jgi:hypothetical protein
MEVEDKHHMAKISLRNVEPLVDLVAASSRRASVSSKLKAAFALTYRELDEVQRCKEVGAAGRNVCYVWSVQSAHVCLSVCS